MPLSPEEALASKAIEVITSVRQQRIAKAKRGRADSAYVGIPWRRFLELVDEVEEQFPGWIGRTYDLIEKDN